ncbi:MAG: shikimate kinase [Candidatus Paceibacterota bacterium]
MDNIFLVIGPSGAGKSKTVDKLNLPDNFVVRHLDKVICNHNNESRISQYLNRIQNPAFFHKSVNSIRKLKDEFPDKKLIIDIGAGSIDYTDCLDFYSNFFKIYLHADKEILYNRILQKNPDETRDLKEYLASEYSPHRIKLYASANFTVDNSKLTIEQTANALEKIIFNASK